jgi:adenylate cyclase
VGAARRASDVGRSLGVDYLVEGGVRRHGTRARVAVALVKARDEVQTWGDIYEHDIVDAVPAQIEIASRITRSIIEQTIPG